jgi:hypothetical protein
MPNGDLILPGMDRIVRIDSDGVIKAQSALPACKWLKTSHPDSRIRLACARLEPPTASTIIEYDDSFTIVNKIPLGHEDVGLPAVSELADSTLVLLGNDGPAGAFVQTYNALGRPMAKYRFPKQPESAVIDGVPVSGTEFAVVRYDTRDDHFTSVVTWLQ